MLRRPLALFRPRALTIQHASSVSDRGSQVVRQGPVVWRAPDEDAPFVDSAVVERANRVALPFHEKGATILKDMSSRAIATLLPHGYPASVKEGYDKFVVGQVVASVASSAGGVLSMQALLHAVGLGSGAIPMAAALQWVVKDGLGQLGGVLFAANVNTRFDSDPRRWRLLSSVALDAACLLELLSPAAPALFIPLAATANVGKNVSWLAASASRAAIHHSFAKSSNLADITVKTGSQSIGASLAGTSLGIGLASQLGPEWGMPVVLCFAGLSSVHLGFMWWSLTHVKHVDTLNSQRLALLAQAFLVDREEEGGETHRSHSASKKRANLHGGGEFAAVILSPAECSSEDSFVPNPWNELSGNTGGLGELGVCLGEALPAAARTPREFATLSHFVPKGAKYVLSLRTLGGSSSSSSSSSSGRGSDRSSGNQGNAHATRNVKAVEEKKTGQEVVAAVLVLVALEGAEAKDLAAGAVHALLLRRALEKEEEERALSFETTGTTKLKFLSQAEARRAGAFQIPNGTAGSSCHSDEWLLRTDLLEAVPTQQMEATTGAFAAALEVSDWQTEVHHL